MGRLALILVLSLSGCSGCLSGVFEAIARALGPDDADEALPAAHEDLRIMLRALAYLPEAIEDPIVAAEEGFEIDPPDATGRRAWRKEWPVYSETDGPTLIEGAASPFGPDAWEIEILQVEEGLEATFVFHRRSESELELIGQGELHTPTAVNSLFRSLDDPPYTLVRNPASRFDITDVGCLKMAVEYFDDRLRAFVCIEPNGVVTYTDVVRNGKPDPNGLRER